MNASRLGPELVSVVALGLVLSDCTRPPEDRVADALARQFNRHVAAINTGLCREDGASGNSRRIVCVGDPHHAYFQKETHPGGSTVYDYRWNVTPGTEPVHYPRTKVPNRFPSIFVTISPDGTCERIEADDIRMAGLKSGVSGRMVCDTNTYGGHGETCLRNFRGDRTCHPCTVAAAEDGRDFSSFNRTGVSQEDADELCQLIIDGIGKIDAALENQAQNRPRRENGS